MKRLLCVLLLVGFTFSAPARGQTATEALSALWNTICASSVDGTLLFQRCGETVYSPDPNANLIAARGQNLENLAGQARTGSGSGTAMLSTVSADWGTATASLDRGAFGDMSLALTGDDLGGGWSLFATLQNSRREHAGTPFESAFDARAQGFTLGADHQAGAWVWGAAIHHARNRIDYRQSSSRLDDHETALLLFANRRIGVAWSLDAYLGSGRGNADIRREIRYSVQTANAGVAHIDSSAKASTDSRRDQAGVALSWFGQRHGWDIDLGGGFDLARHNLDDYAESGGNGLALYVSQPASWHRFAHIDAQFGRTVSTGWGIWQPGIGLSWQHALSDSARRTTIRFVEDPEQYAVGFDAQADDRNWGEVAVVNRFVFTHGHSGFIEYRQRVGHAYLDERVFSIGWRIELD